MRSQRTHDGTCAPRRPVVALGRRETDLSYLGTHFWHLRGPIFLPPHTLPCFVVHRTAPALPDSAFRPSISLSQVWHLLLSLLQRLRPQDGALWPLPLRTAPRGAPALTEPRALVFSLPGDGTRVCPAPPGSSSRSLSPPTSWAPRGAGGGPRPLLPWGSSPKPSAEPGSPRPPRKLC